MNVDHYFTIGSMHAVQGLPCEDYAGSGVWDDRLYYGMVADGCSGARARTDIGARVISLAFTKTLKTRQALTGGWFQGDFLDQLREAFKNSRLSDDPDDYFATMVGFAATAEQAEVFLMGDGAVAAHYKDDRLQLVEVNWYNNMPYYLNYSLAPEMDRHYWEHLAAAPAGILEQRTTIFRRMENSIEILTSNSEHLDFDTAAKGLTFQFQGRDLKALAVMTDGITQINGVPAPEVASRLLAFKTRQGVFVKRRSLKALAEFHKNGQVARDDLALACVVWED